MAAVPGTAEDSPLPPLPPSSGPAAVGEGEAAAEVEAGADGRLETEADVAESNNAAVYAAHQYGSGMLVHHSTFSPPPTSAAGAGAITGASTLSAVTNASGGNSSSGASPRVLAVRFQAEADRQRMRELDEKLQRMQQQTQITRVGLENSRVRLLGDELAAEKERSSQLTERIKALEASLEKTETARLSLDSILTTERQLHQQQLQVLEQQSHHSVTSLLQEKDTLVEECASLRREKEALQREWELRMETERERSGRLVTETTGRVTERYEVQISELQQRVRRGEETVVRLTEEKRKEVEAKEQEMERALILERDRFRQERNEVQERMGGKEKDMQREREALELRHLEHVQNIQNRCDESLRAAEEKATREKHEERERMDRAMQVLRQDKDDKIRELEEMIRKMREESMEREAALLRQHAEEMDTQARRLEEQAEALRNEAQEERELRESAVERVQDAIRGEMQGAQDAMRVELQLEHDRVRNELQNEIAGLRAELTTEATKAKDLAAQLEQQQTRATSDARAMETAHDAEKKALLESIRTLEQLLEQTRDTKEVEEARLKRNTELVHSRMQMQLDTAESRLAEANAAHELALASAKHWAEKRVAGAEAGRKYDAEQSVRWRRKAVKLATAVVYSRQALDRLLTSTSQAESAMANITHAAFSNSVLNYLQDSSRHRYSYFSFNEVTKMLADARIPAVADYAEAMLKRVAAQDRDHERRQDRRGRPERGGHDVSRAGADSMGLDEYLAHQQKELLAAITAHSRRQDSPAKHQPATGVGVAGSSPHPGEGDSDSEDEEPVAEGGKPDGDQHGGQKTPSAVGGSMPMPRVRVLHVSPGSAADAPVQLRMTTHTERHNSRYDHRHNDNSDSDSQSVGLEPDSAERHHGGGGSSKVSTMAPAQRTETMFGSQTPATPIAEPVATSKPERRSERTMQVASLQKPEQPSPADVYTNKRKSTKRMLTQRLQQLAAAIASSDEDEPHGPVGGDMQPYAHRLATDGGDAIIGSADVEGALAGRGGSGADTGRRGHDPDESGGLYFGETFDVGHTSEDQILDDIVRLASQHQAAHRDRDSHRGRSRRHGDSSGKEQRRRIRSSGEGGPSRGHGHAGYVKPAAANTAATAATAATVQHSNSSNFSLKSSPSTSLSSSSSPSIDGDNGTFNDIDDDADDDDDGAIARPSAVPRTPPGSATHALAPDSAHSTLARMASHTTDDTRSTSGAETTSTLQLRDDDDDGFHDNGFDDYNNDHDDDDDNPARSPSLESLTPALGTSDYALGDRDRTLWRDPVQALSRTNVAHEMASLDATAAERKELIARQDRERRRRSHRVSERGHRESKTQEEQEATVDKERSMQQQHYARNTDSSSRRHRGTRSHHQYY